MYESFQLVKDAVDIVDVAERYGISVNSRRKAHCPWHTDDTPSLSFKEQRFKCFSCNEGGDVIDLVRLMTKAATPLEAVRDLNHTLNLGIELDGPASAVDIRLREITLERKRRLEQWERKAFLILSAYSRFLWQCRKTRAPRTPDDEPDALFVEALTQLDYIEYILDEVFMKGGRDEKTRFLMSHAGMIREIEQRLIQRRAPYAHRDEAFYQEYTPFVPVVFDGGTRLPKAA